MLKAAPGPSDPSAFRALKSACSKTLRSRRTEIQLNDPQTMYRRREDSQWTPFAIDLSRDVAQWPGISDEVRRLLLFVLTSLMVAEERITKEATSWRRSRSTKRGTCSSTRAFRTRSSRIRR